MSASNCKKCRRGPTESGEIWCGGCLSLASSLGVLRGNWWSPSHRKLAEEVLVQASRQVRAIHSLDRSLQSFSDSCEARIKKISAQQRPPEPPLPPRRSVPVLREAAPKAASPPREERPVEEPFSASNRRNRSPSSAPDFGSQSDSNFSSPRVARGAEVNRRAGGTGGGRGQVRSTASKTPDCQDEGSCWQWSACEFWTVASNSASARDPEKAGPRASGEEGAGGCSGGKLRERAVSEVQTSGKEKRFLCWFGPYGCSGKAKFGKRINKWSIKTFASR